MDHGNGRKGSTVKLVLQIAYLRHNSVSPSTSSHFKMFPAHTSSEFTSSLFIHIPPILVIVSSMKGLNLDTACWVKC